ncbi:cation-translocating P-type ATPase [Kutzneria albida]|uniref:Putative cation-transporting ATPase F n=1 Tax=Kutzneria albida DSM 43870 TaxID=1449976 RepID=W5W774_9PSEU|nr:HAD-IC family P-type ATPase [Kutzneria albida]AHH97013.1 putative cation-transporting ATPase F [Kutzneria albida DSM 43870]
MSGSPIVDGGGGREVAAAAAPTGLSSQEAALRLTAHGPNLLPAPPRPGAFAGFLQQLRDPLVYVLLAAAAVSVLLGQPVDASVILGVVLVNAVIGQVQRARAEHALAALVRMCPTWVRALRDGVVTRVRAEDLVPGDAVLLAPGDQVPADCRVLTATGLLVNESALTGESVPVLKQPGDLPPGTPVADRTDMVHAGTLVTGGDGTVLVTATGGDTELGAISDLVAAARPPVTPLTRQLARFSRQLALAITVLAAVTFVVGLLRGQPVGEVFTAAVAMAVGAIPEGLPAAVTIVLAVGVVRMAGRHAIVRRLPAAETLGSTTVICTDKTGTLTANRMTVRTVLAEDEHECLLAGVLCNDAAIGSDAEVIGDPTEGALLGAASSAGLSVERVRARYPRLASLPFDASAQLMVTVHDGPAGLVGYVKGAPERVLPLCDRELGPNEVIGPVRTAVAYARAEQEAARGLRVLALARFTPRSVEDLIPHNLVLVGFQAMLDPARPEAVAAVAACREAGVEVKMITGDHAATARAEATEFGLLGPEDTVLSGPEVGRADEEELLAAKVLARVSPEQKLRLVELLQRRGHVVAMTGDGVNDAPALRRADIGVAMGLTGTDAAKLAADVVLADDNFASVEAAVEQGRAVYDNLRKFIAWTLPTNIAEGVVLMVAVLAGVTLPLLPVQVLWINMTTAVLLGLPLAFESVEPGVMARPPRPPGRSLLSGDLVRRIVLVGLLLVTASFAAFQWQLWTGASTAAARTTAMAVFVVAQIGYLLSCRSLDHLRAVGRNWWLIGGVGLMALLQAAITFLPVGNELFHTAPPSTGAWLVVAVIGAATYLVAQADKLLWAPRR